MYSFHKNIIKIPTSLIFVWKLTKFVGNTKKIWKIIGNTKKFVEKVLISQVDCFWPSWRKDYQLKWFVVQYLRKLIPFLYYQTLMKTNIRTFSVYKFLSLRLRLSQLLEWFCNIFLVFCYSFLYLYISLILPISD